MRARIIDNPALIENSRLEMNLWEKGIHALL
jgi:hypothetical protein